VEKKQNEIMPDQSAPQPEPIVADCATPKRVYAPPEVTALGTLEEMTQGGGGVLDDGGSFSSLV